MSFSQRPMLTSYKRRVTRQERLRQVLPWLAVFIAGFGLAWLIKPGPQVIDTAAGGCTYTSVVPMDVLPQPKAVTVNVYNSTKRVGLASITSIDLATRGFKAGIVGSSDATIKGIGIIRYGAGARDRAERLAAYIPGAVLKQVTREDAADRSVDLIVGEAFGSIAPDAQVTAVLSIPSAQASGPGCPTI